MHLIGSQLEGKTSVLLLPCKALPGRKEPTLAGTRTQGPRERTLPLWHPLCACSGHRWASSWASCADPMPNRQFDVQPVSATGGGWEGVAGCSSLPQFLVSARFGAANMQIPCSFYFGSVFFSHTFRSSHQPPACSLLPPSAPIVSFAFVLLPLCHVFYPCRFAFLFLLRRRAYYALHILHFYLKATQRKTIATATAKAQRCKSNRQKEQQAK